MLELVSCPECGVPAEISERVRLPSTDGPVDHIAVQCAADHYFRMAADMLAPRPQHFAARWPPQAGTDMTAVRGNGRKFLGERGRPAGRRPIRSRRGT